MINLGRLMSTTPIPVAGSICFHQPKIIQVLDMGEQMYWGLLKIWDLKRKELIPEENEYTSTLSDYEVWMLVMFGSPIMAERLKASVDCFLHTKIEFLSISGTIIVGEGDESSCLLDENFYNTMKDICRSLSELGSEQKEEQYKETENMSEREKQLIERMKASAQKLDKIKNGERDTKNRLVKQIISLVAIGRYTFDEVYQMTIVQLIYLLKKYVEIQQYELYSNLSPYIDSKKTEPPKHWLDT